MLASIRRSISRKFLAAVMATTFIAVLVSGMANLAYDVHDFRASAAADLATQSAILAQVNLAAIEFDDTAAASTTLNQLQARPGMLAAAIYRADGSLFASWRALAAPDSAMVPARPGPTGDVFDGNDLRSVRRIARGRENLGTIYLHAYYPLDERVGRYLRMLAAVSAASLLIAALVSMWLQAAVTRPVRAVTHAVRELVASRDFSRRVPRTTIDETGILVDAFNTMLEEIGTHATLLEQSNASLQHEAVQRSRADEALQALNASLEERIAARSLELEQANEQLRHAQKMEAIGQLTGGVAHDFNNVLQVISGNLQLLAMTLPGDAAALRRIEMARFATARGAKLSAQLLAFARKQPLQPAPTDLGRVLRAMDDMLRRALGEGIDIETSVAGGLWNTLVDPHQIENVVLNLGINARDAMGGRGRLTLELGNAVLDERYAAQEGETAAGQYVMLAISDTGCGMPPSVIERAFEPFFTTKREGEGTGLGLSMAFGFVKQSGGHIKIYSEVGAGTTIKIYLPRSHEAEAPAAGPQTLDVVGGNETILVVEDDLTVQATVVDTLAGLGYRVLRADNGDAALAVLEGGVAIDLLFTDVVMPGAVRSPELARRARALLPRVAVLFTSGYTRNAIVHGGRLDAGVELISKPYQRADLARKIRQVLGAARQHAPATVTDVDTAAGPAAEPALRIAVVEDNADARGLLVEMLGMLGHEASEAADAAACFALFERQVFDVLLTDVHLPGMSGLDLAGELRLSFPRLHVIVSSGAAVGLEQLPDVAVLPKPYRIEALQQALAAGRGTLA